MQKKYFILLTSILYFTFLTTNCLFAQQTKLKQIKELGFRDIPNLLVGESSGASKRIEVIEKAKEAQSLIVREAKKTKIDGLKQITDIIFKESDFAQIWKEQIDIPERGYLDTFHERFLDDKSNIQGRDSEEHLVIKQIIKTASNKERGWYFKQDLYKYKDSENSWNRYKIHSIFDYPIHEKMKGFIRLKSTKNSIRSDITENNTGNEFGLGMGYKVDKRLQFYGDANYYDRGYSDQNYSDFSNQTLRFNTIYKRGFYTLKINSKLQNFKFPNDKPRDYRATDLIMDLWMKSQRKNNIKFNVNAEIYSKTFDTVSEHEYEDNIYGIKATNSGLPEKVRNSWNFSTNYVKRKYKNQFLSSYEDLDINFDSWINVNQNYNWDFQYKSKDRTFTYDPTKDFKVLFYDITAKYRISPKAKLKAGTYFDRKSYVLAANNSLKSTSLYTELDYDLWIRTNLLIRLERYTKDYSLQNATLNELDATVKLARAELDVFINDRLTGYFSAEKEIETYKDNTDNDKIYFNGHIKYLF